MTIKEIPLRPNDLPAGEEARAVMEDATGIRAEGMALFAEEKYDDALGRVVDALRRLRDFPDYGNREFRALLAVLLFDL